MRHHPGLSIKVFLILVLTCGLYACGGGGGGGGSNNSGNDTPLSETDRDRDGITADIDADDERDDIGARVSNLSVIINSSGEPQLNWSDATWEAFYNIEQQLKPGDAWQTIANISGNSASHTLPDVSAMELKRGSFRLAVCLSASDCYTSNTTSGSLLDVGPVITRMPFRNSADVAGSAVAISADGNVMAYQGYNCTPSCNGTRAVHIYEKDSGDWIYHSTVEPLRTDSLTFGSNIELSADGSVLLISDQTDSVCATGVSPGDVSSNSCESSGAVYVFEKDGSDWSNETFIKASNSENEDDFGMYISLSGDGNTIAVSAPQEDSCATGFNGEQENESCQFTGAVYIFENSEGSWEQTSYVKRPEAAYSNNVGYVRGLSHDGNTLLIADRTDSNCNAGINPEYGDNNCIQAAGYGAVHILTRSNGEWSRSAYIKPPVNDANTLTNEEVALFGNDRFAYSAALSADGNTLVISADEEDSCSQGVGGDMTNNDCPTTGAVFVYTQSSVGWVQSAFLKQFSYERSMYFGHSLSLSADGSLLAVTGEVSNVYLVENCAAPCGFADVVFLFNNNQGRWTPVATFDEYNTSNLEPYPDWAPALSGDGSEMAIMGQEDLYLF